MLFRSGALALVLTALLTSPPASADTAKPDALYVALLKAQPANLPAGVAAAHARPANVDSDDASAGATANVQISLEGQDSRARVNYLLFATADQARLYLQRFEIQLSAAHMQRNAVTSVLGAVCANADGANAMICLSAIGRVIVYSQAALLEDQPRGEGATSLAGPLMKLGVDHLTAVRGATGAR